ncbi:MAG: hypothetical protein KIG94_05860 [Acetatifactor sp.]|nr:hypothetical protein [Acetatifactor sp.]
MSFFQKFIKTKEEKELLLSIEKIEMNMSNNYKDAAQMNLAELEAKLSRFTEQGKLSDELREKYESIVGTYRQKLKGYTHKDQKPYWT